MNSIIFEAENSKEAVHFLDVTIALDVNGQISTTLYTKPAEVYQLWVMSSKIMSQWQPIWAIFTFTQNL